ncbi:SpoIIE family protein phosphatase [Streptomyces sp. JJ36]|uniref:ATP-binding SpoIIE family protein phosphatase n=1 Tax=Streptomyces sp. JJ36 TaxID=2736645 RepID=UPI001F027D0F|nr:SpoIIE family protein phosphatase [Streptomyces sp. JJ36]MCF6523130.1 SpoIIE family protein phosphatase [Streptomyces sp. JJ36]
MTHSEQRSAAADRAARLVTSEHRAFMSAPGMSPPPGAAGHPGHTGHGTVAGPVRDPRRPPIPLDGGPHGPDPVAALLTGASADTVGVSLLVLDTEGGVLACTAGAEGLLGRPAGEVCGRRVDDLFPRQDAWRTLTTQLTADLGTAGAAAPPDGPRCSGPAGGDPAVRVHCRLLSLEPARTVDAPYLLQLAPATAVERQQEDDALVRALFSQSRIGLLIHDAQLRVTRTNLEHSCFRTHGSGTRLAVPQHPEAYLEPDDAAQVVKTLRSVAETGEPLIGVPHRARCLGFPERERIVSLSAVPLRDAEGDGHGVLTSVTDITDSHRDKRRLAMASEAARRIGTSLDITRCAEELTEFLVPDFADLVAVDLTEVVLVGEEPCDILRGVPFTRVAAAAVDGAWPSELYAVGETARIRSLETAYLRKCAPSMPDFAEMRAAFSDDVHRSRLLLPEGAASYMFVPLHARGLVLGSLNLWRKEGRVPFDARDAELAEEVVSRAALAVDNARRYTQERRTAEALRRSLLPPSVVDVSAAEAAGTCLHAATTAGVGGTWFDVIPLSSARVAFVVGDSVGHGMETTAATGRLRTAVQTLSDLDLPPEELLAHLDDLVVRLSAGEPATAAGGPGRVRGATCLYAVYDPVTGRCTMASAGHPPPAVIAPDGRTRMVSCEPGPPLGEGGEPFEPVEVDVEPGSLFALYSGNLLSAGESARDGAASWDHAGAPERTPEPRDGEAPGRGARDRAFRDEALRDDALRGEALRGEALRDDVAGDDAFRADAAGGTMSRAEPAREHTGVPAGDESTEPPGSDRLCTALEAAARAHDTPVAIGRAAMDRLVPEPPAADTNLLVARPRELPAKNTAGWEFDADPAIVGRARETVATQLGAWGLEELAFTTELIVSELLTNAIRYAGGPVRLRLIRDETLICEVSDPAQAHPHLRRARLTDEGGRGLFLVHQLTQRWGSRYTCSGKTIWTEQVLPGAGTQRL